MQFLLREVSCHGTHRSITVNDALTGHCKFFPNSSFMKEAKVLFHVVFPDEVTGEGRTRLM